MNAAKNSARLEKSALKQCEEQKNRLHPEKSISKRRMEEELHYIGHKIQENAPQITLNIPKVQDSQHTQQLEESGFPLKERISFREELIGYLGQALCGEKESVKNENVKKWSIQISKRANYFDVPLSQCPRAIAAYCTALWDKHRNG